MTAQPFEIPELTVGEVVERLQKLPPNVPVWLEGCDCTQACVSIVLIRCRGGEEAAWLRSATNEDPYSEILMTT